jgi:hypothetical protein
MKASNASPTVTSLATSAPRWATAIPATDPSSHVPPGHHPTAHGAVQPRKHAGVPCWQGEDFWMIPKVG